MEPMEPTSDVKLTQYSHGAGCGCNAAIYLVAMPQSSDPSTCHDFYCDANDVCGVGCVEIDLMEANEIAFVSTVHVAEDGDGEGAASYRPNTGDRRA